MSSITGLSSVSHAYRQGAQAAASGLAGYMQQLGAALQSGNIPAAQQALANTQSSVQGVQAAGSASGGSSQGSLSNLLKQGLSQIGQNLQAGNLTAAQADFTSLQQRVRHSMAQGGQVPIQHFNHNSAVHQPGTSAAAGNPSPSSGGNTINTIA
jgi:hypothetical protein